MGGDVLSTLDAIRWTVRHAGRALADRWIGPSWQRFLLMSGGRCRWVPYGVVGMLGTWNYPLFLNAPPIAQALAAGNAVVYKASEFAPLCGARLQDGPARGRVSRGAGRRRAGGPGGWPRPGRIGDRQGDVHRGDRQRPAGPVRPGRRGIPALAELSGFDPAIVLADAPVESTVRCLTWAAFVGCGQTCVAVKRVYAVGDPRPWADALAASARALRVGDPSGPGIDVGPLISARARERLHAMIEAARSRGATVLAGGRPARRRWAGSIRRPSWPPTQRRRRTRWPARSVRSWSSAASPTRPQAIRAANRSPFALSASVWSRDARAAAHLGGQLQAGMVTINDAVTPTAHAGAPFGGVKASGFGRTKGLPGLREFAQPQVVFTRPSGGFRPQLFPYPATPLLARFFSIYRAIFHSPR